MTQCIINETSSYVETILFRPIEALADQYEVVIQSQLLHARDPASLQVKYRSIVSTSALRELRDSLNKIEGIWSWLFINWVSGNRPRSVRQPKLFGLRRRWKSFKSCSRSDRYRSIVRQDGLSNLWQSKDRIFFRWTSKRRYSNACHTRFIHHFQRSLFGLLVVVVPLCTVNASAWCT